MRMRKTYIRCGGGSTRLPPRRDRGAVCGEGRLETHEARGEARLGDCIKTPETAMLQPVPRQEQRLIVGLHIPGILHLRVLLLHHVALVPYVLLGMTEVHGQLRLRKREVGVFEPKFVICIHFSDLLSGLCLGHLHHKKKCYGQVRNMT